MNTILTSNHITDAIIHNHTCVVKDCLQLKGYGDTLFCGTHRLYWRDLCKALWPEEKVSAPIEACIDFDNVFRKLRLFCNKQI